MRTLLYHETGRIDQMELNIRIHCNTKKRNGRNPSFIRSFFRVIILPVTYGNRNQSTFANTNLSLIFGSEASQRHILSGENVFIVEERVFMSLDHI